jgi:hypothetical protein
MNDAYLAIPLLFTRATAPAYSTIDRNVAFRDGFTSVINSLNVQLTNAGQVVQESDTLNYINHIRRLIEGSKVGDSGYGGETGYACDEFPNLGNYQGASGNGTTICTLPANGTNQNNVLAPVENFNVNPLSSEVTVGNGTGIVTSVAGAVATYYLGMQCQVRYDAIVANTVTSTSATATGFVNYTNYFWCPLYTVAGAPGTVAVVSTTTGYLFTSYANCLAGYQALQAVIAGGAATTATLQAAAVAATGIQLGGSAPGINFFLIPNTIPTLSPYFNKGHQSRLRMRILNSSQSSALGVNAGPNQFVVACYIFLRDIHSCFREMVWPLQGVQWNLRFGFSAPINSTSTYNALLTNSGDQPDSITFIPQTARLYIKQITLNPAVQLQWEAKWIKGCVRDLQFLTSTVNVFATNSTVVTANIQAIVNIQKLRRVWIFAVPTGASASNSLTMNPTIKLQNVTLTLNNDPISQYPINGDHELYAALREQCLWSGRSETNSSVMTIDRFLTGGSYLYPFNFERIGIRGNINRIETIQVNYTRVPGGDNGGGGYVAADFYLVAESASAVKLYTGQSGATIIQAATVNP